MENKNLSDKSKEALKSETWNEIREDIKKEIVKEYLKIGYTDDSKQHDIDISGVTYKVLERGEITTFYDAQGNTLFDVENKILATEYEKLTKSGNESATEDEKKDVPADEQPPKLTAKEKLEKELKSAKDKSFAEPIIAHLIKRCEEDKGMADDVVQEHKTWEKCFDYIYEQAKKQKKGNSSVVRDDVVYEWAEDYYRKDDKAEEEEKARKEAEAKAKREKAEAKRKEAAKKSANKGKISEKPNASKEEQAKPKKNSKEMEGQIDMFSIMGMKGGGADE